MIEEILKTIPAKDKATRKGLEISKLDSVAKIKRDDYSIEILSFNPIEKGVEMFVKVWDKNGDSIGFGKDGTIEIERFVFINPPVLVDDPNGTIVRTWLNDEGVEQTRKLREDVKEALLQDLEHTISVSSEKHNSEKIITGKIGNTHTTYHPVAGQVEPVDGRVFRVAGTPSFDSMHDSAGTGFADTNTSEDAARIVATATTDEYSVFVRSIYGFDTSDIDDGDTISSGTFSVYSNSGSSADNLAQDVVLDKNVPISTSALAAGDYNIARWDVVEQASNRIDLGAWVGGDQYRDFTLNTAGKGNVSKTALTWFGIRLSSDFDDIAPTWSSSVAATANGFYADETGTTKDPKLVVVHGAVAGPATLKTRNTVVVASVKTGNTVNIASIKTINTAV